MNSATPSTPLLATLCLTPSPFSIRFDGKRDRKLKVWLPKILAQRGAHAGAAHMVRYAIQSRVAAARCTQRALELTATGGAANERKARTELIHARNAREEMRRNALQARAFACHLPFNDPRTQVIIDRQLNRIALNMRAATWSFRWGIVREWQHRARGRGDEAKSARIQRLLRRIAVAHDALTPYDDFLLPCLEG